jgi:recombination protein RecA
VRIDVRRVGPIKVSEESVGSRTRAKVVKNKLAVPFKEAEFDIRWGTGIDGATDLLDYGIQIGLVEKNGSHLSFAGEQLGQGRERARDTILRGAVGPALRAAVEAAAPGHRARRGEPAQA